MNIISMLEDESFVITEDDYSTKVSNFLRCDRKLVFFGCGNLAKKIVAALPESDRPVAYIDSNSQKWGDIFEGVEVLSVEDTLARFGTKVTVVVTILSPGHAFAGTEKYLNQLGFDRVIPVLFLMREIEGMLPHYAYHSQEYFIQNRGRIIGGYKLLNDAKSRDLYASHVAMRISGNYSDLPSPEDLQYFPPDLIKLVANECFVDCGAYDGDTIRAFRELCFDSDVFAFEADPLNFQKLERFVDELPVSVKNRTHIFNMAVSDEEGVMNFSGSGIPGSAASEIGEYKIRAASLDTILSDIAPTFIKLDIEGAELSALQGAENLIKTHSPIIAVCAYHRPDDLWILPEFIKSINGNYKFYLRWHSFDGWESVIYAIPLGRLINS